MKALIKCETAARLGRQRGALLRPHSGCSFKFIWRPEPKLTARLLSRGKKPFHCAHMFTHTHTHTEGIKNWPCFVAFVSLAGLSQDQVTYCRQLFSWYSQHCCTSCWKCTIDAMGSLQTQTEEKTNEGYLSVSTISFIQRISFHRSSNVLHTLFVFMDIIFVQRPK